MLPERGLDPKTQPIKPIKKLTLNAMSPPALISQSLCKKMVQMFRKDVHTCLYSHLKLNMISRYSMKLLRNKTCKDCKSWQKTETFDAVWTYCTNILGSSNREHMSLLSA